MSTTGPDWLNELERQSNGRPIILVEGADDVRVYRRFLDKLTPGWDTQAVLLAAQGKPRLLRALKQRPHWVGLVDRDEWREADVLAAAKDLPRLKTLPRFCLESCLSVPNELWVALPAPQQSRIGDADSLVGPINAAMPDWVAHGAMWRVLRELYHLAHLPDGLDDKPVTDLTEITRILADWHRQLDPQRVIGSYQAELQQAQLKSSDDLLRTYIHGGKFFRQVVCPTFNDLLGQRSHDDWIDLFSRDLVPPPDVAVVLRELLNLAKTP